MALAMFYQLSRSGAGDTVASLLGRALTQGWRVMIRGTDPARLALLDDQLWLGAQDAFVPHGIQGSAHDADQPVLLGTGAIANDACALMLVDRAEVSIAEAQALSRVWLIFDGADTVALEHARGQWTALTQAGVAAQYWSEETGSWAKKAEKASAN